MDAPSSTPQQSGTSINPQGQQPHRVSHAVTACESCKKHKRRCDQNQPCSICVSKGVACIYDPNKDGRRGRKRTFDELHSKVETYETVLESLRASDDRSAQDLLRLIRNGASLNSLKDAINVISSRGFGRSQHSVMSISRLTDTPPIQVPARPWTAVTHDDDFVSHLVSVYFTWHYAYLPILDGKIFVEAMKSGDLATPFCSPVLVNAILFIGCIHCDHPSVMVTANDPSSRGAHFQQEAERLWALEENKVSLVNLQSLLVLLTGLAIAGRDRLCISYVSQSVDMSAELASKFKKRTKKGLIEDTSTDFQRSISCAVWGAYVTQIAFGLGWQRLFHARKPQLPRPYSGHELQQKMTWSPYPYVGTEVVFEPNRVCIKLLELHIIGQQVLALTMSANPADTPASDYEVMDSAAQLARIRDLEKTLAEWYGDLPFNIPASRQPSSFAAAELDLLLTYHAWRIHLAKLAIHLSQKQLEDATNTSSDAGGPSANQEKSIALDRISDAVVQVMASTSFTAFQFEVFRQTFNRTHCSVYMLQAAMTVVYSLMDFLNEERAQEIFQSSILQISISARRWMIARGFLRMIWGSLQERGLQHLLSEASRALLRLHAVDNWTAKEQRIFQNALYPEILVAREDGRALADMGDLLEKWAKMGLGKDESKFSENTEPSR